MLKDFIYTETVHWILIQHSINQIFDILWLRLPEAVREANRFTYNIHLGRLRGLLNEWKPPGDDNVQTYAKTPHVSLQAVRLLLHDLGGGIGKTPTGVDTLLLPVEDCWKSEIYQLRCRSSSLLVGAYKYVVKLNISVKDPSIMNVLYWLAYLFEKG